MFYTRTNRGLRRELFFLFCSSSLYFTCYAVQVTFRIDEKFSFLTFIKFSILFFLFLWIFTIFCRKWFYVEIVTSDRVSYKVWLIYIPVSIPEHTWFVSLQGCFGSHVNEACIFGMSFGFVLETVFCFRAVSKNKQEIETRLITRVCAAVTCILRK